MECLLKNLCNYICLLLKHFGINDDKNKEMTASLQRTRENLHNALSDETKPWTQYFNVLEAATGINRSVIFIGGITLLGWWMLFGISDALMSVLIGITYPVFQSICALEAPTKDDDVTRWLMYWIVFGSFCFVEFTMQALMDLIPFYSFFKCMFLIWLMVPVETNGSILIYTHVIRPMFQFGQDSG